MFSKIGNVLSSASNAFSLSSASSAESQHQVIDESQLPVLFWRVSESDANKMVGAKKGRYPESRYEALCNWFRLKDEDGTPKVLFTFSMAEFAGLIENEKVSKMLQVPQDYVFQLYDIETLLVGLAKACRMGDGITACIVLEGSNNGTLSPKDVKKEGRKVAKSAEGREGRFDQSKWTDDYVMEVLKFGLVRKFGQNPELKELLLSTGDRPIAEASSEDGIYGIHLGFDDDRAWDPANWKTPYDDKWSGQTGLIPRNVLGKALMEVRDEFRH